MPDPILMTSRSRAGRAWCAALAAAALAGLPAGRGGTIESSWAAAVPGSWQDALRWNPAIVPVNTPLDIFNATIPFADLLIQVEAPVVINRLVLGGNALSGVGGDLVRFEIVIGLDPTGLTASASRLHHLDFYIHESSWGGGGLTLSGGTRLSNLGALVINPLNVVEGFRLGSDGTGAFRNEAGALLELRQGPLGFQPSVLNNGTFNLDASTVTFEEGYSQEHASAQLNLDGGTITGPPTSRLEIKEGTFNANGAVDLDLIVGGPISAPIKAVVEVGGANRIGVLQLNGNVRIEESGGLAISLASPHGGGSGVPGVTYDFVDGHKTLTVNKATLTVRLLAGFTPELGMTFTFAQSETIDGTGFANVGSGFAGLIDLDPFVLSLSRSSFADFDVLSLTVVAVPEPGSGLLLALGAGGLFLARKRQAAAAPTP